MQQQSKTDVLITKTNYRKHKQKLNQIKNNAHNASLQFYGSGISKPLDRKKILMLKMKREEIQQENQHLRRKIQRINGNTTQDGWRRKIVSESEQRRVANSLANHLAEGRKQRYAQEDADRMEVTSDCGDGENIKYVIPSTRMKVRYSSTSHSRASDYNAIMFNLREKEKKQQQKIPSLEPKSANKQELGKNPEGEGKSRILQQKNPSIPALQSNPKLKQMIRESVAINKQDLLYNEPEKQAHRIVLFKKTKIPEPMISFLIEISLIQKQLLIIGYGMGMISQDYRLIVSRKRTKQLLEEYRNNYQSLWERVTIDPYDGIRISGFADEQDINNKIVADNELPQIQKQKIRQQKRYEITQDFLQRNYYTLLRESGKQKQEQATPTNPYLINKITNNKNQQSSLNSSATKPKSMFRNKVQFHKDRGSNGNILGVEKRQNKVNFKTEVKDNNKDKSVREIRITEKSENKSELNHKKGEDKQTKSQKKLTNKSQYQQQQQYEQQFEQSNKVEEQNLDQQIDYKNQSKITSQKNTNKNKSKKIPNKSQKLSNNEDEYEQNFEEDINKQPEQYSMQYESNPSKVLNNKSSINAVKKKTINNNLSQVSGVSSMVEEYAQQDIQQNKSKQTNGKSKNIEKKSKKQEIDEEYGEEFQD